VDELYQQELTQDFEKIKEYQVKTYYHNNWKNEYKRWALMLSYTYQGEKKELTAWNSAKVYDMINTQPVVYDLKKVKIPSMIIAGELDPMIPDANILRSLTSQNLESNFRIESMKGIGHSPHIEDFPAFYQLLSSFIK
jgi:pimeloyl-ACP methyl ester carboxylesterase